MCVGAALVDASPRPEIPVSIDIRALFEEASCGPLSLEARRTCPSDLCILDLTDLNSTFHQPKELITATSSPKDLGRAAKSVHVMCQ